MIAAVGAAYGTAKSGIGIAGVGTFRPDLIMKVRDNPLTLLSVARGMVEKSRANIWFL